MNWKIKQEVGFRSAIYRGIPCWFSYDNNELRGKNIFYDRLVEWNCWWDFIVLGLPELPILVQED